MSRVFVLRPLEKQAELPAPTAARITVALPTAAPGLDTEKIILFTSEQALDYYAKAEWASRLPEMVRAAMIGSLENSGHFASVTSDASAVPANYLLLTEIRRFEAQYNAGEKTAPTARVELVAKMIALPSREVVRTIKSSASVRATEDKIAEVVRAFDAAFAEAEKAMIEEIAMQSRMLPVTSKKAPKPR